MAAQAAQAAQLQAAGSLQMNPVSIYVCIDSNMVRGKTNISTLI